MREQNAHGAARCGKRCGNRSCRGGAPTPAMQRDQRRLEACWALKAAVRRRVRSSCRKADAMGRPTHMKDAYAHRMLLMCCSDSSCTPHTAACCTTPQPLCTRSSALLSGCLLCLSGDAACASVLTSLSHCGKHTGTCYITANAAAALQVSGSRQFKPAGSRQGMADLDHEGGLLRHGVQQPLVVVRQLAQRPGHVGLPGNHHSRGKHCGHACTAED